jgi:hypothetical protein
MKVKTSKRNHVWVVQRKLSGRWVTVVDDAGPVIIRTRQLARNISREYKNLSNKPRSFRVRKLA